MFAEKKRLEKVREQYLALKDYSDHAVIVTGDRTREEVAKEIKERSRKRS